MPSSPCCPPSLSEWRDQNSAGANRRCTALDSYSEMKKTANLLKKGLTPETPMGRAFPRHDVLAAVWAVHSAPDRRLPPMKSAASKKCLFHAGFLHVEKFSRHPHRRASGVRRTVSSGAAPRVRDRCGQTKNRCAGIGRGKRVGLVTRSHRANQCRAIRGGDQPPTSARSCAVGPISDARANGAKTAFDSNNAWDAPRAGVLHARRHVAMVKDRACVSAAR